MSLAIISASYKRPQITELFCLGIQRLRKYAKTDIPVIVTGDYHPAFDEYGIEFHEQDNEPVSEKFNTSLRHALMKEPRHIMVLGSDNLLHNSQFQQILDNKEGTDYLGFQWVYYYSLESKETVGRVQEQLSSIIIGAGRTFSVEALLKCKEPYKLWDKPMNKALDNLMYQKLRPHIRTRKQLPGYIIDVKGGENINPFNRWKGLNSDVPEGYILDGLSKEEKDCIKRIKEKL